jgi:hypothetical protein
MIDLQAVLDEIVTALKTVDGVRFYDYGDNIDPPAVLVSPPSLDWEGYAAQPTSATIQVFLVVAQNDRALPQMLKYLPSVSDALDAVTDAVVRTATPTIFQAGSTDLPCYAISVEISL